MCFHIDKDYPSEQIAKKDIVCYKTLERSRHKAKKGVFNSIHRGFVYDFNKQTTYNADTITLQIFEKAIDEGIHSFSVKPDIDIYDREDLFKCIIPKGTPYYYSKQRDEYVSLKIKFVDRLTFHLFKID